MQHNVIFIGSQFRSNAMFYEYINRALLKALTTIDSVAFFDDSDKALFLVLETMLHKPSKLVLVCSKSSFSVVGRLLCTLTEDTQVVKDDMLLPLKTDVYTEDSYLLHYEQTQVGVILAEVAKALPRLLFEEQSHQIILHIFEESESDIKLLLSPLAESYDVIFKVTKFIEGWYTVEATSLKYGELRGFISATSSLLNQKVIATTNIMAYIIDRLQQHDKKVTTAESCTGGLIASLFTKERGSSNVFDGGIVTYSNEKKIEWLGVEEEILREHGAVSEETVLAMSQGAKDVASADFALSVSGVAGPTGGSKEKPVGLVYLSICTATLHKAFPLYLQGDRNYIQIQTAYHAIKSLILSDKKIFF